MIQVSVTKLRANLFAYLEKVSAGETVVIQRNKRVVARLTPSAQMDWRDRMKHQVKLRVSPENLMAPLDDDVWEPYR